MVTKYNLDCLLMTGLDNEVCKKKRNFKPTANNYCSTITLNFRYSQVRGYCDYLTACV